MNVVDWGGVHFVSGGRGGDGDAWVRGDEMVIHGEALSDEGAGEDRVFPVGSGFVYGNLGSAQVLVCIGSKCSDAIVVMGVM